MLLLFFTESGVIITPPPTPTYLAIQDNPTSLSGNTDIPSMV